MLSFKKHIQEVAEPKAGDEKRFKDKHVVAVTDYPGNDDDSKVQNMTKKSPAKKKRLADMDQAEAEKVYEEKMMKCEDCGEEYDADEGEHECDMEEHFERIAGELLDEGINVYDLTEEQLDEILGRIARGAGRLAKRTVVNKQGNFRFSAAGRDDSRAASADKKAGKLERKKQRQDAKAAKRKEAADRLQRAQDRLRKARAELNNSYVPEEKMSDSQMKKREEIVKGMKDNEADLKKRYGDRWKSVMYATATKKAMEEGTKIDPAKMAAHLARNKKPKKMTSTQKSLASIRQRAEEVDLDEAFKVGAMRLKDGSSVKLAKEDVQALDNLYKNLNSSNRKKMQEKLEANKKSFGEILAFAKQAM